MRFPVRSTEGEDPRRSASRSTFVLINLQVNESFEFQYFPQEVETSQRAEWERNETTIGTQQLSYANREPKRVEIPELWLDGTKTNQSLTPTIKRLFALMKETERGMPPPLLAIWGDREERVVLEEVRVTESHPFDTNGNPLRARVSLVFIELQDFVGTRSSAPSQPVAARPPLLRGGTSGSSRIGAPE